jgi:hypothetical protein
VWLLKVHPTGYLNPQFMLKNEAYDKIKHQLIAKQQPKKSGCVELKRSAVAYRTGGAEYKRRLSLPLSPRSPSLRFSAPLIEPDVTISVIRLSDGFHMEACTGRRRQVGSNDTTPSSPNTRCAGNCRQPDPATLCRRRRKARTEWYTWSSTACRVFDTEP